MQINQKLFQVRSFLWHWLRALNEHALHPPFVFNIYTRAIKGRGHNDAFTEIEAVRKRLLKNTGKIKIEELGAGSGMNRAGNRKIRSIARHSLTKASFSRLLYRLIQHMEAQTILELGTSFGINTLYLSAAAPGGHIYTLEGCPQTAVIAQSLFKGWQFPNIELNIGTIDSTLQPLLNRLGQIDAAYLDANHTYEATIRYFNTLLPYLHPNSFLVLDDIYWSPGMQKAWREIQQHHSVQLSLDVFDAGILFFRPGLQKAHYVLAV